MILTEEALRARWQELTSKREEIDAQLHPAWAELNALVAGDTALTIKQAHEREAVLREQIKAAQAELFPIEQERAMVARALGGQTG